MITQRTIDDIHAISLESIIGKSVTLKKQGVNFQGCCPFHEEKTASFVVSESKGFYKCFGCGAAGDGIKFIMEINRMDYVSAIKHLAKEFNIVVEETTETEDREVREKRLTLLDMNENAKKKFVECFLKLDNEHEIKKLALERRNLTTESIIAFQIGYAPDMWDFLSKKIVDSGFFGMGEELGLVKANDNGKVYDFFRNRLMFPIQNEKGEVIGFSGRRINEDKKEVPKYINSPESILYKKSETLFGLYQAKNEIRKKDHAFLVEGNVDVIMMHQAGITNTVGTCGTALTESHAQKLYRFCSSVSIMFDADEAGRRATLKAIDILLMVGFSVYVVNLENGLDPDSMIQMILSDYTPKKKQGNSKKKENPAQ